MKNDTRRGFLKKLGLLSGAVAGAATTGETLLQKEVQADGSITVTPDELNQLLEGLKKANWAAKNAARGLEKLEKATKGVQSAIAQDAAFYRSKSIQAKEKVRRERAAYLSKIEAVKRGYVVTEDENGIRYAVLLTDVIHRKERVRSRESENDPWLMVSEAYVRAPSGVNASVLREAGRKLRDLHGSGHNATGEWNLSLDPDGLYSLRRAGDDTPTALRLRFADPANPKPNTLFGYPVKFVEPKTEKEKIEKLKASMVDQWLGHIISKSSDSV